MIAIIKDLTKIKLVYFVLICEVAGYFLGFEYEHVFSILHFALSFFGLALVTMGSFALNEAQESDIDKLMERTSTRPIPSGALNVKQALAIAMVFMLVGLAMLYQVQPLAALLALLTILFYNLFYTKFWKMKWAFGAVPGALPGAMPVVIGYVCTSGRAFTPECIYLFLIMFLWQMPHFWSLAIRFKEDYNKGGVPVLPVKLGDTKTVYHMGLYVFVYVALALAAPWFVRPYYAYFILVVPFSLKVLWEFYQYAKTEGREGWLKFFLWVNFSMLAFLWAPVIDKWLYIYLI